MDDILFSDKDVIPTNQAIAKELGSTYKYWEEIKELLSENYGIITEEWKYYGIKNGWILKNIYKKRNLFFFKPYHKYFLISFTFGERAVSEIVNSNLPPNIIKEIKQAKKFAEGKVLNIEVKKRSDIDTILRLIDIKLNN
ncbi:MAG: DUF3788 family protein [Melioribacteraceae bacterium]|nr:DUF3788 family protein [Melioribacteraceae bacterium]